MGKVAYPVLVAVGSHFVITRKADLKAEIMYEGQQRRPQEMEMDILSLRVSKSLFMVQVSLCWLLKFLDSVFSQSGWAGPHRSSKS